MHAWLCENPIGVEALHWKELPTPEPKAGRGARSRSGREPELPRPADRAEQVPDEAAAAVRAGLGVRRRGRGGGRRRDAPEGRRCRWPRSAAPAASAPMPASTPRCVMPLPQGFAFDDAAAFILHLRHDAPRAGRPRRAEGRRDAARARRGRRRRHGGDPDRQGRSARASSPPRRATRSASCAAQIGADATINYASGNMRDELKAAHRRQGPGRRLRPGRRRPRRAGVPLDRLARPLPGGRLRAGRHPGAAAEPGAAQGRVDRRRVLGRLRAARAEGQRRRRWPSWRAGTREGKVKPVIDRRLPMSELPAAYARMGSRQGARQAGDDERLTIRRAAAV